jgi:sulfide dehydrogenase cytochrome subunit
VKFMDTVIDAQFNKSVSFESIIFKPLMVVILCLSSLIIASPPDYIKECMDCHGENGVSTESDIPTIAGASAAFIESTFYSYKEDTRVAIESKYRLGDTTRAATDMKKIAEKLSEQQITEVSEYFSKLPFVASKQEFDPAWAKIGKKVHDKKCSKCHEDGGSSAEDDSGILAGQWTPYLRESMKNIINNSRETDKKMKKKIKKLKDKEWQALLHYYASQQN